ncbi:MAG: hypothetical protein KDB14_27935 [Planctomycetales bacterium]|nr:hypothetical protein [Planctomycetales bacterium]
MVNFDQEFVLFAVWSLLGAVGCIAAVVAILIAWLGRPGAMLVGGAALGAGLALLIAMWSLLPRYWWVSVLPIACGIQALRMWRTPRQTRVMSFGIRTAVLVIVSLSLLLAGATSVMRLARRDAQLGEQLEEAGGYVVYSFDGVARVALLRNESKAALQRVAPIMAQMRALREIGLEGTPCDADALRQLADLPYLRSLSLQNAELGPEVPETLGHFAKLQVLDLMVTSIGDADLQPLAGLKRLRRLYLERTSATAAGIAALRQQLPRAEISPEP